VSTVTAHIVVREPARAADWYQQALGAAGGGTHGALHIATDNVDGLWEQAVAAGAEIHQPLQGHNSGANGQDGERRSD